MDPGGAKQIEEFPAIERRAAGFFEQNPEQAQ
jgi:hypothetical protein